MMKRRSVVATFEIYIGTTAAAAPTWQRCRPTAGSVGHL